MTDNGAALHGHAKRNAGLRRQALVRAQSAPPLAKALVRLRADTLGLTRTDLARQSGIPRGTLRDLELGIHRPARKVFLRLWTFFRDRQVPGPLLDQLRKLYLPHEEPLPRLLDWLQLLAGGPQELARCVGISPTTLWEYQRGGLPTPWPMLRRLCKAVGEDPKQAEALWLQAEVDRLAGKGYPEPLARFWALAAREGHSGKSLLAAGLRTETLRRLRYLELTPWEEVADAARALCRDEGEWEQLRQLWRRLPPGPATPDPDGFGATLKRLRDEQGISRRELADCFGVRGKKPADVLRAVEEKGFFSMRAYPAGLTALLTTDPRQREHLRQLWQRRRERFHRRRPRKARLELRLCREWYGIAPDEVEPILGYTPPQYQQIERGNLTLPEAALGRIREALESAGARRVEGLIGRFWAARRERSRWQSPRTVEELVTRLAVREGGLVPLARLLREAGCRRVWPCRLREIARGTYTPPWPVLLHIAEVCGVGDLDAARQDWRARYRQRLEEQDLAELGVELRLLIAEITPTLREFAARLPFSTSFLTRQLQRADRGKPLAWAHVHEILEAAELAPEDERWRAIHAWWYAADLGRRKSRGETGH